MKLQRPDFAGNTFKKDLIVSFFTGVYFLLLLLFHPLVINFTVNRFGLHFKNESMGATTLLLFVFSPLAAGYLNFKLNAPGPFSFDRTLINCLTGCLAFIFPFIIFLFFAEDAFTLAAFAGISFFSLLFSFLIGSLSTMVLSRILTKTEINI